jgi:mannan endo-1,4-beta-mannosidase
MYLTFWYTALSACLVSARSLRGNPLKRTNNPDDKFVSTVGTEFQLNGSAFKFIGTNAYWLHTLNTDADISHTFANMSAAGIKVVRTWAFNDVHEMPVNGTWFQLIANGTTTINNGTNGLPRLDKVVKLAEQHGIYLLLSLTNNWNPLPGLDDNKTTAIPNVTRLDVDTGNSLNRNYLSNDYGGMDAYVRQFGVEKKHDEFYTNATIIEYFKNYTTNIVSRYVNSPAIFAWELANDPRCNSTLPSRAHCTAQTVTKWHSILAKHIRTIDPNHLITSGNHGFFCTDCPKLFPIPKPTTSTPQPSAAPGQRRRKLELLTKKNLLKERAERRRQTREQKKRIGTLEETGIRIRGRWISTPTRRQENDLGSAFDGSQGVDSEDILGIPQIGFSSFQLFPDQNQYAPYDPHLSSFNNTVQAGTDWIDKQLQAAALYGKPSTLTGFGLVTQANAPDYVPFNSTAVANDTDTATTSPNANQTGVADNQRDDAYQQWLQAGIVGGINGMIQYQWGQSNLTAVTGTTVSPNSTSTSANNSTSSGVPTSANQNETNVSPDDGYSMSGTGEDNVQSILSNASEQIGADGG